MPVVIAEIRKRRYVCGLLWQSLSHPRELRAEAADLAQRLNMDLMVLRKDLGLAQAGYASSREGAQPGMLSLAAIVAAVVAVRGVHHDGRRQPASSWLGAIRIDQERWAYFAVRDDSFLPSGDFAGSRAEVLERMAADYGLGGWNAVIGDAELADQGFHNFEAVTLDEFLPRSTRRRLLLSSAWELKPVERSRKRMLVAAAAAAASLAAVGLVWWQHQQAIEAQIARDRARHAEAQRTALAQARRAPPPPWPAKPVPREFARACAGQLEHFAPGGWRLEEYRCTASQATHAWVRGDSNVAYLLAQHPEAAIELAGDRASVSRHMALPVGIAEELLAEAQLLRPLVSRLQELGLRFTVKEPALPAPASTALPGVRQAIAPQATWKTYTFSVQAGGLPLADVASILSQPGVRVDQATYRQGEWILEGVAYAK